MIEDFERQYWRLRRVVVELVGIVSALVGAGFAVGLWFLATKEWGWGDNWAFWAAFALYWAVAVWMKKQLDVDVN